MQKRSKTGISVTYTPIRLPDDFPCAAGELYAQMDKAITYLHRHECLEIGYCYSGSGIFMVDQKTLPFQAGDVSVISSQEFHLARSVEGTVSQWVWVNVNPLQLLGTAAPDPSVLNALALSGAGFNNIVPSRQDPELGGLVKVLIAELREKPSNYQDAVRGLVWTIMCRLRRLPGVREPDGKQVIQGVRPDALERVAPALHFMLRQYPQRMSIEQLARLCGMSEVNFRRVFQAAAGAAPLEYLTRLRIRMAAAMLETTPRPVSDIAMTTGFSTLSSFNRHFRSILAASPRDWRKRTKAESA